MAKPWARFDQNYINHPKFLALDAVAICLWVEGKNYCDMQLTDGIIPRPALRTFRFANRRAVEALTTPAGLKPNGEPYAPLWEVLEKTGFKMHDYLDHNDCREAVLERVADADEQKEVRRLKNRERQTSFRNARKGVTTALANAHVTAVTTTPTEAEAEVSPKETRTEIALRPTARSGRPIFAGQRLTVFEWMLTDCVGTLGGDEAAFQFDLHSWFHDLDASAVRDGLVIPKRDGGAWLQAQLVGEAQRRGLSLRMAYTPGPPTAGKLTTRMAAMVANARTESV